MVSLDRRREGGGRGEYNPEEKKEERERRIFLWVGSPLRGDRMTNAIRGVSTTARNLVWKWNECCDVIYFCEREGSPSRNLVRE